MGNLKKKITADTDKEKINFWVSLLCMTWTPVWILSLTIRALTAENSENE